jgi:hypothetical protein
MKCTELPSSGGKTANGIKNRDMLELWLMSLLFEGIPKIFQRGGMPPRIHDEGTAFFNSGMPD